MSPKLDAKPVKNISFDGNIDTHAALKGKFAVLGIKMQDFFNECMEKKLIELSDELISLDDYANDSNFIPFPPFPFTKGEIDRVSWFKKIESLKQDSPELKQLHFDAETVESMSKKKMKYDTVSVHIH